MAPISNESPTAADHDRAPEQASVAPGQSDLGRDFVATERDERRHQRALARDVRDGNARARDGKSRGSGAESGKRLHQSTSSRSGPSRQGRLVVGETVSVGLIGIIVVGLLVGAVLGALGASGWVIGLLVATLTVILLTGLRRLPRQRSRILRRRKTFS